MITICEPVCVCVFVHVYECVCTYVVRLTQCTYVRTCVHCVNIVQHILFICVYVERTH